MYPHERSLVKQLNGKPFAIIGVNSDDDLEQIRKIVDRKNLTWRSFQNESSTGTISDKWGVEAWPTIFIIDAKGVIRFRGHENINATIEDLLAEMGHEVEIVLDDPGEMERPKRKRKADQETDAETDAEKDEPYWATINDRQMFSGPIKATRISKVTEDFPRRYRKAFDRYVQVVAPNGEPINIFAQKEISDAQLRHVRDVMLHYLNCFPSSKFGSDKGSIASRMAENRAMMMICKGHDGQFREPQINAQPLYADETIVEGTDAYIDNDFEEHRDATLEEILHCVHDNGIGVDVRGARKGVLPEYQKEIRTATTHAMKNGIWPTKNSEDQTSDWIEELREEGSLTQEYMASVIDSYYGLWGPFDEDVGMWGIYIAKTRADIEQKDPKGFAIVEEFFHPNLTYAAEIDDAFEGTFSMTFDATNPYTHKSQYLLSARLTGKLNSNLVGNDLDNRLTGNEGNNVIDGRGGNDTVVFPRTESEYKVENQSDGSKKVTGDGTDTLFEIETIIFDGQQIEEQRFVQPVPHGLSRE